MTLGCVYCSYGSWDLFREAYAAIEKMKQLDKNKLQAIANQVGSLHSTASCCSGLRVKSYVINWVCSFRNVGVRGF